MNSRSGWWDLNPRPPAPKAGALPSCATTRDDCTVPGFVFVDEVTEAASDVGERVDENRCDGASHCDGTHDGPPDKSFRCRLSPMGSGFVTREGLLGAGKTLAKVVSLFASMIFVAAFTTDLVSERTGRLDGLDLAIGHVEMLKLESAVAVIVADDVLAGRADATLRDVALDRLDRTLGLLQSAMGQADVKGFTEVETIASQAIATLRADEVIAAGEIVNTQLAPAADRLNRALANDRIEVLSELRSISSFTGAGAVGTGAVLVFLLPISLILGMRAVARRQITRAEREVRDEASKEIVHSKDQFLAGVSHELRTPLTAVVGFAHILAEIEGTSSESIEIAREIGFQGSELARMVEDLLVAGRLDEELASFQLAPTDPMEVLIDTLAMIPNSAHVKVDLEPGLVVADAGRLEHVLRNLISNGLTHGADPVVVIGRRGTGSYRIVVGDRGAGLSVSAENAMFNRFLHDGDQPLRTGSVGLGLHVARALVEGMDGDLFYERVGSWTRFHVDLPLIAIPSSPKALIDA